MRFTPFALGLLTVGLFSFSAVQAQTASDVLEQSLSGVVTVAVYQTADTGNKPLGVRGNGINPGQAYAKALNLSGAKSSGSGFVIESGGQKYVLTNAHVVESAADATGSLAVFSISQKKYEVRVVGGDALYDFAVLAFVTQPGPELVALPLRTQPARIGERVYAIGNPEGEYPYTVTDGIVSAKNRTRGGLTGKFGFLQTTATVIWGNSGGPLIDEQGQVLGINSQIAFTDSPDGRQQIWLSQINFALETPIVQRLLTDVLTNDGLVRRAYLGLEFSQTAQLVTTRDGRSRTSEKTLPVLSAILQDSPAKVSLTSHIGEQIIAVNGEEVRSVEEVLGALEKVQPGNMVALTFGQGTQRAVVNVKSTTLTSIQLESIARFVFTSNRLRITDTPLGVSVQFMPGNTTYEMDDERKFKKMPANFGEQMSKNQGSVPSTDTPDAMTYQVVAAGVHSEQSSKLWRVSKLGYLGAVCRLMGLSGAVDLAVVSPTNSEAIRFARKWLSGQEDAVKSCLWY